MRKRKPWEPNPDTILEDLLALAYPVRTAPGGARRPPRDLAAERAKRRADAQARARAAGERRWMEQKAERDRRRPQGTLGARLLDRWVRAMEPGQWYARGDVVGARHERGAFLQKVYAAGYAERRRNPEWGGISDRNEEPHWLYRLTTQGEELRSLLELLD